MGTPFMIDDEAAAKLRALKETAEAHPFTEQDMRAIMDRMRAGHFEPDPRNAAQTIELPFGYTVTFTIEWQPMGLCRHVSMASPRAGRMPIEMAMQMLIPYLGFQHGADRQSWPEVLSDDRIAHNIIEVIQSEDDIARDGLATIQS